MPSTPSTVGSYTIERELGRGGMGVVYLAHDSRLERRVALKALPPEFAADPERLARFSREAKLLASLNHPNIAAIYGIEEAQGARYLVLEYVEGDSLAERLARGPLPLEDALTLGAEIASALEAAHEAGVVHRDLKPANIVLTGSGRAKILDFGLAKALAGTDGAPDVANSPTLTALGTMRGVIVGTAAYMSPEQARGRETDRRADVWAFGCVLYEMLSGRQAFSGETVSDTLAAVLKEEPNWNALPAETPTQLRDVVKRCLRKNPVMRLHHMGDVRLLLAEADEALRSGPAPDAAAAPPASRVALGARIVPWGVAALAIGLAAVLTVRAGRHAADAPLHASIPVTFADMGQGHGLPTFALSPDGTRLVYVDASTHALVLRSFSDGQDLALAGTDDAGGPFFSPDGRWIGFTIQRKLEKIAVSGGAPIALADVETYGRGACWVGHSIVFARTPGEGLSVVDEDGGSPRLLTTPDRAKGEVSHRLPSVMPDGHTILYTIKTADIASFGDAKIAATTLDGRRQRIVFEGGASASYVEPGYLLYAHDATCFAIRFDARRLKTAGTPAPVVNGVAFMLESGSALYSVSRTGTLVYASPAGRHDAQLVWFAGRTRRPLTSEPFVASDLRISPDATRIALVRAAANDKLWLCDVATGTLSPLSGGPGNDYSPVWSPDGRRVAFGSDRLGMGQLFWVPADESAPPRLLHKGPVPEEPSAWSPDGRQILLTRHDPTASGDVWVLDLPTGRTAPIVATRANEHAAVFSPDGRWLAYVSDESGRPQVYARSYPSPGVLVQVSRNGGTDVAWPSRGHDLFFRMGDSTWAAPVVTSPTFHVGPPRLVQIDSTSTGGDVAPDGVQYVLALPDTSRARRSPQVSLVLNWFAELREKMRRAER